MQPLVSLRTLSGAHEDGGEMQPLHPHQGAQLAEHLRHCGFDVRFVNQLKWRLPLPACLKDHVRLQVINARVQLSEFDAVLTYAEGGLKFVCGSFWRRNPRMVPVLLTNRKPRKTSLGRLAAKIIYRTALRRADAVICCLRDVETSCHKLRGSAGNVFYAPTTVDAEYYDPASISDGDAPAGMNAGMPFVLAVGDSSRDDQLLYDAFEGLEQPLVRVTRDPRVTRRIENRVDSDRGDVVLENVHFRQLRWLYSHAAACVLTSSLDAWQAAGSTALTEAMACGAPCVVQGGGCLEREFGTMLRERGCENGVRFVAAESAAIRKGIRWALSLDPEARQAIRANQRQFAIAELPILRAHDAFAEALRRAMLSWT